MLPAHQSILTVQDSSGNTPLHYLFGNLGDLIPAELVNLILSFCQDDISLGNLLSIRNLHGLNVLHLLFGEAACSDELMYSVISRLPDEDFEHEKKDLPHPILLGDVDGELPAHFACYVGLEPTRLKAILDIEHLPNLCQKSLFCVSTTNVMLPVDSLFYWFGQEYEEQILRCIDEDFTIDSFLDYVLACTNDSDEIRDINRIIRTELWPRLQILIQCALQFKGEFMSPVHLASAIVSFPSTVLKTSQIVATEQQFLVHDLDGNLPIHIAASVRPRQLKHSSGENFNVDEDIIGTSLWQSKREPGSIIKYLLEQQPMAANIPNADGRLPLHIAIESGLDCEADLKPLLDVYPQGSSNIDPITKLHPFMLAAVYNTVDAIFELLLVYPSVCNEFTNE